MRAGLKEVLLGAVIIIVGETACGSLGRSPASDLNPAKNTSAVEVSEGPVPVDVLPDMVPWSVEEVATFAVTTANASDRLVSCDDWTQVDPTPITGQRIITFQIGSANLGLGHMRIRRDPTLMADGWHFYQTTSYIDEGGECQPTEREIAIVPTGPGQSGRWLPLASFSLYTIADDGSVGDLVVCQMKRWCCLSGGFTCATNPPCSLPRQGDWIDSGTRDVYPFHWLDQFVPIQNVPSGQYWFEHRINPAGVIIESDPTNNSLFFKIEIDQDVPPPNTARIIEPPGPSTCPM